jgi:hypothetical protein
MDTSKSLELAIFPPDKRDVLTNLNYVPAIYTIDHLLRDGYFKESRTGDLPA